jgi:hypothetical protein
MFQDADWTSPKKTHDPPPPEGLAFPQKKRSKSASSAQGCRAPFPLAGPLRLRFARAALGPRATPTGRSQSQPPNPGRPGGPPGDPAKLSRAGNLEMPAVCPTKPAGPRPARDFGSVSTSNRFRVAEAAAAPFDSEVEGTDSEAGKPRAGCWPRASFLRRPATSHWHWPLTGLSSRGSCAPTANLTGLYRRRRSGTKSHRKRAAWLAS